MLKHRRNTVLEIYQIKISEGHATLIVTKHKTNGTIYKSVLIDAGKSGPDARLIEELILKPEVANGRLDVVMLTHHDDDHWGGLPGANGLLSKRCNAGGSLLSRNQYRDGTTRPLLLYYSLRDGNIPSGDMTPTELRRRHPNNLRIRHWFRDLDIYLAPRGHGVDIKIQTIAVNGFKRDDPDTRLRLNSGNVRKNKNSAVSTIVWGDFSFLIQGDLYATKSTGKITRTTADYRRSEESKRFPVTWNAPIVPIGGQNAITPARRNLPYSNEYFVRESTASGRAFAASTSFEFPTLLGKYEHWVANPEKWHHDLGTTINQYNGNIDKYGYACVALVPHHGALSSNHWFNTRHAVIGSNKNSSNGHPNVKAISSLFNTSGATNFYITYLLDNQRPNSSWPVINRLTEMRDLLNQAYAPGANEPSGNRYLPGVNVYYLDDGNAPGANPANLHSVGTVGPERLSYFKFIVDNTGRFKVETEVRRGTNPLKNWTSCRVN